MGENDPLVSLEDHADMPTGVPHVLKLGAQRNG